MSKHCIWCGNDAEKLTLVRTEISEAKVCDSCIKEHRSWITWVFPVKEGV